ncbi:hypothetical protein [Catellatospora sp. NPDC049133]|uniref:hypothetical protein n=1 Tax=Catellatospora sp. NPDC049133 TaxID=3155499 RepID=UPI00340EAA79
MADGTEQVTRALTVLTSTLIDTAVRLAIELAERRAQRLRQAARAGEQRARTERARLASHRAADAAIWRRTTDPVWWRKATPEQVARAWRAVSTWHQVDPEAAGVREAMADRLRRRGVDIDMGLAANPGDAKWLATALALAEAEREERAALAADADADGIYVPDEILWNADEAPRGEPQVEQGGIFLVEFEDDPLQPAADDPQRSSRHPDDETRQPAEAAPGDGGTPPAGPETSSAATEAAQPPAASAGDANQPPAAGTAAEDAARWTGPHPASWTDEDKQAALTRRAEHAAWLAQKQASAERSAAGPDSPSTETVVDAEVVPEDSTATAQGRSDSSPLPVVDAIEVEATSADHGPHPSVASDGTPNGAAASGDASYDRPSEPEQARPPRHHRGVDAERMEALVRRAWPQDRADRVVNDGAWPMLAATMQRLDTRGKDVAGLLGNLPFDPTDAKVPAALTDWALKTAAKGPATLRKAVADRDDQMRRRVEHAAALAAAQQDQQPIRPAAEPPVDAAALGRLRTAYPMSTKEALLRTKTAEQRAPLALPAGRTPAHRDRETAAAER